MGERTELGIGSSKSLSSNSRGPCPCCAFFLEDSLFLPSSLNGPNNSTDERDDETIKDEDLSFSLTPHEALQQLTRACPQNQQVASCDTRQQLEPTLLLVDTHGHAHLNRESQGIYNHESSFQLAEPAAALVVMSLTCAVQESDWRDAVSYASESNTRLFGLGIHPWYLADLSDTWLQDLESLLQQHPNAIVGEIGLCKMARFVRQHPEGKQAALSLQRNVFVQQMRLAAKLQRPVSVHCVKQHGVLMSALKELAQDAETDNVFPPAIGMHSFTGTAHHVKELLKFEKQHSKKSKLFYFGFSHAVNVAMCTSAKSQRQGIAAIRAVPADRLMAESDVHAFQDVATGTAGAIAYLAFALQQPLYQVAQSTTRNGLEFLQQPQKEANEKA